MVESNKQLKSRDIYLSQLIEFKDKEPIKVITGIRRSGKSSLLKLMQEHLLDNGVKEKQIISMNFESFDFQSMNYTDLYEYVKNRIVKGKRSYLFFDELQRIDKWENAINAFRVDFDCDIYITGSNSYLLSTEYSTYLAGRYVEIKMYPLSFKEFIDFHGFKLVEYKTLLGNNKKRALNANDEIVEINDLFDAYLRYGGMPGIMDIGLEQNKVLTLLDGVYSTVIIRDILQRHRKSQLSQISDTELLRKIVLFLADNIGNNTSINSISNVLLSQNMLQQVQKSSKPATKTISSYVASLKESFLFYEVKRFDIKGKEYLSTLGKYYIVDIGLRNYLLGFRDRDKGHILENIVYFELLRRGYDVCIGKINDLEVDFIATKPDEKIYIQVNQSMKNESVRDRELNALQKINNNYRKMIISLDKLIDDEFNGIEIVDLIEWLLK
ncbi:putative ATPase, AAA+ superfamily [Mycoplasmopsis bovigenitalium]|uniref:Putative ATPase, AAA+ superfamily n=1 Tax=Mycoplasmopsis bovigenitalium TaxID=2112 RepID=A0A449A8Y0_9BACT|nr:ATP-binding protein [Mycoplasmopsis bovigenitalium]VEU60718.1 putative ATPase, AAA+ superfamily [Mycoplasmopsis bovigenitalium]